MQWVSIGTVLLVGHVAHSVQLGHISAVSGLLGVSPIVKCVWQCRRQHSRRLCQLFLEDLHSVDVVIVIPSSYRVAVSRNGPLGEAGRPCHI